MIVGLSVITGYFKEVIIVFTIVTVHEMGHYFAAQFFNWKIKSVKLLPFGGVAEVDEHGNRPLKEEFIVILSGPFQHVWMLLIAYGLFKLQILSNGIFELFVYHNVIILIFNLLPILPLDGGKLMLLLSSYFFPYKKSLRIVQVSSFLFLMFFSLFTFLQFPMQMNIWMIVSFLFITNYTEFKRRHFLHFRFLMERYEINDIHYPKTKFFVMKRNTSLKEAFSSFYRDTYHIFILKNGKSVNERQLLNAYFRDKKTNCTIQDLFL
jgi:stage IV sporulation protein FB